MQSDNSKWFFIAKNVHKGSSTTTKKVEYDFPFGEDVDVDCGEAGQAFSSFTSTETLNPAAVTTDICGTVTSVEV